MTGPNVAVVSGAARGIGAAVGDRLLARGWLVVAVDLDEVPTSTVSVVGDVTDEATWDRAAKAARSLGDFVGLVNNAGAQGPGIPLVDTSVDDFDRVLAVNARSTFLGTRLGLRELAGGSVVNVASNAGLRGVPRYAPYVAAKHAVVGLTRTAAAEGARRGVRVNAVAPGPTETRIMADVVDRGDADATAGARARMERANPMRRFGAPDEIAQVITWLLGPEATYLTGSVITVDGGLTAV